MVSNLYIHQSDNISKCRITFGTIVLNGEPFIRYNLRSLYPFAHQIIVVEGACPSARNVATHDGHSRDTTLETLKRFKEEEDPQGKIVIVTAEDEGHSNGFWSEKDEMSQAYAKRVTGNYLWQVDCDEFYLPDDIENIIELLRVNSGITAVTFPMKTFWGGLDYLVDGFMLRSFVVHRLFAWGEGYRYATHRPPTVVDENGTNLREIKAITADELADRGIFMYHYELLFPKQVQEKCTYYRGAEWITTLRGLDRWLSDSYLSLKRPFKVHMVYQHLSWLERFNGNHPPQVVEMIDAVGSGTFPGIDLRGNSDIKQLLKNPEYIFHRKLLKILVPFHKLSLSTIKGIKHLLRGTPLWSLLKNLKARFKGDMTPVPADSHKIKHLVDGWKDVSIPAEQRKLTERELRQMYQGTIVGHWRILADAVCFTGSGEGSIIEIGCATGYLYEVLKHLLGHTINYEGIDYSEAMIAEARRWYPTVPFNVGDATALPLADNFCDILLSGCVLIHVPDYRAAIRESVRVSRKWVIFHKTPVTDTTTSFFTKYAYGVPCVEVHFNEEEFLEICTSYGMVLRKMMEIERGCKTIIFEKV